jgi:hypothetical protein
MGKDQDLRQRNAYFAVIRDDPRPSVVPPFSGFEHLPGVNEPLLVRLIVHIPKPQVAGLHAEKEVVGRPNTLT